MDQDRPLYNIKVVELGILVAGPSCVSLMADWGANCVRVDNPSSLPGAAYQVDQDNHGKRSITLDLNEKKHMEVMEKLLQWADVFVTNYRQDALEKYGLNAEQVSQRYPRLIVAIITGYGREGPQKSTASYDLGAFYAKSGFALAATPPNATPLMIPVGAGDHTTAITLLSGILGALRSRDNNPNLKNIIVETSLFRTGGFVNSWRNSEAAQMGKYTKTIRENSYPWYNIFRCLDGAFVLMSTVSSWDDTCRVIGLDEFVGKRLPDMAQLTPAELLKKFEDKLMLKPWAHWQAQFDKFNVVYAKFEDPVDLLTDPQALAARLFVPLPRNPKSDAIIRQQIQDITGDSPMAKLQKAQLSEVLERKSVVVNSPVDFSYCKTTPLRPAPTPNEHMDSILRDLSLSKL